MRRFTPLIAAAVIALLSGCPQLKPPVATKTPPAARQNALPQQVKTRDASDDFFEQAAIPKLKIDLSEAQEKLLREDARRYVRAKLIENDATEYPDVAMKLKGA